MVEKLQQNNHFLKSIALFVLLSFCLSSVSNQTLYAQSLPGSVHPHHGISQADPMSIMGSLKLPEELGIIQEFYTPNGEKPDQLVIYLQSAHTNFDSETNTKKIKLTYPNL